MPHIRRLPSGKWNAQVRLPNGQRRSYTHPLRKVVVDWAAGLEDEMRRGIRRDPKAGRVTLKAWSERWFAARVVDRSTMDKDRGVWRRYVEPEWQHWPLEAISGTDVQGWVRRLSDRGLAPATVNGAFQLLSAMLAPAVRDRVILANPCVGVQLPRIVAKPPRYFSDGDLDEIVAALDEPFATMTALMGWTGLRYEEAAGLHGHRVDWLRGVLHVVDVWTKHGVREYPKSKKSRREVPIEPEVLKRMSRLVEGRGRDGLVFEGPMGGPVNYQTFYWHWRRAFGLDIEEKDRAAPRVADVRYQSPHTLRHTAASRLVMEGVDLYRVQQLLGHESFQTTMKYAHLAPTYHDAVTDAWARSRRTPAARHVSTDGGHLP